MAEDTPPRKVTLRHSNTDITVEEAVAKQSQFLKRIIEEHDHPNVSHFVIDVPSVTGKILKNVLDYCAKHVAASATATTSAAAVSGGGASGGMKWWEEDEYVRSLESEPDTLMAVIAAASNLEIKSLLDLLRMEFPAEVEVALKSSVEAAEEFEVALKNTVAALKSSVEAEEFAVEEAAAQQSQTPPKKMVRLKSSDGVEFVVEEAAAIQSQTIKNIIENDADFAAENPIYLRGSTSKILSKVIEYCEKHIGIAATTTINTTTVPAATTNAAKATAALTGIPPALTRVFRECWKHIQEAKAAPTKAAAGASLIPVAISLTETVDDLNDVANKLATATNAAAAAKLESSSSAEGGSSGGDSRAEEVKNWDAEFVKGMEAETLFDVLSAAVYLDIQGLLELCCEAVAEITRGKTPVETRKMFIGINQKYDTQSQITLMKENKWSFH